MSFFAVPSLSPSYLEVLHAASEWLDLHVYILNPCREYWGDIHSPRESRLRSPDVDPAERYFSAGNELLAAWGRAGRDMIDALIDAESADAESDEYFVAPEESSRLAAVQRDILDLRLSGEAVEDDFTDTEAVIPAETGIHQHFSSPPAPPVSTSGRSVKDPGERPGERAGADDSVQIHVCHSAVREAEVLHDRLLGLFDSHPDLEPADVLVLAPDLARYGPALEAVFGAAGRIPFDVTRVRASDSRATGALLDLLALPRSRYPAEAVIAPLGAEAVRARFGLEETDLPLIRTWLRESGVRWGIDAAHRGAEHLPETAEHTWRQGIRRLLLGYAAAGGDDLVAGLVPCPPAGVAGFEAGPAEHETLGRFLTYCEAVFELRSLTAGERSAEAWGEILREVVSRFFMSAPGATPTVAEEAREVRELVRDFAEEAGRAESPLSFDLVRDALRERADEVSTEPARLADGVTVARLAPGAVFPAEVVCVVGLNGSEFPRSPQPPTFDLVAAAPSPAGRPRPPSRGPSRLPAGPARGAACLPGDLHRPRTSRRRGAASIRGGGRAPGLSRAALPGRCASRLVIPSNPTVRATSPRTTKRRRHATPGSSVTRTACCGPRRRCARHVRRKRPPPASTHFPPGPHPHRERVALSRLVSFFAHPARSFLRERLGLRLESEEPALDEDEPFELDGLDRYVLRSRIWESMRAGSEAEHAETILRGSGRLPQRALGHVMHERAWEEMEGSALDPRPPSRRARFAALRLRHRSGRIPGGRRGRTGRAGRNAVVANRQVAGE